MTRQARTCASCNESPLQASIDNGGIATCATRQKPQEWKDRFCVLYDLANDFQQRRAMVAKMMQQPPKERQ